MAIRRPSIYSPQWLYQDFSYLTDGDDQYRFIQVKWDGKDFKRLSETFDFSNPPFVGTEQRGGPIVAQLDYKLTNKIVTVEDWQVNWRDEWPLRLAVNYLVNCLYPMKGGYVVRAPKEAYAFWVSEQFIPLTNDDSDPYVYQIQ